MNCVGKLCLYLVACLTIGSAFWLLLRRILTANQLTGTIPDSLGLLSHLQQLCEPVRWLCAHARARDSKPAAAAQLLSCAIDDTPLGSCLRCVGANAGTWALTSSRA
jgi:hypothetical protein